MQFGLPCSSSKYVPVKIVDTVDMLAVATHLCHFGCDRNSYIFSW